MTRQEIEKQIAELQKQLAEMPEKWEPKGGDFWIDQNLKICHARNSSSDDTRAVGIEYATREQAEKAAKAMRAHNRLLAYVAERAPDYEIDTFGQKWFVSLCFENKIWIADWCNDFTFGMVFMPEHVATELAAKLNSGEVEL